MYRMFATPEYHSSCIKNDEGGEEEKGGMVCVYGDAIFKCRIVDTSGVNPPSRAVYIYTVLGNFSEPLLGTI